MRETLRLISRRLEDDGATAYARYLRTLASRLDTEMAFASEEDSEANVIRRYLLADLDGPLDVDPGSNKPVRWPAHSTGTPYIAPERDAPPKDKP
jgi:hypothetical protein